MNEDLDLRNIGLSSVDKPGLVYPELSYQIVGALFEVYNELGGGLLEKTYQQAVAKALRDKDIAFQEQMPIEIRFRGERVGKQYLDFLIEDSVILELKQGDRFRKSNIEQILSYLRSTKKQLAILANFGHDGVSFRRLVNIQN